MSLSRVLGAGVALMLMTAFAFAQTGPSLFVEPRPSQGPAAKAAEKRVAVLRQAAKRSKDGKAQAAKVVGVNTALLAAPDSLTGFTLSLGDATPSVSGALESRTKDGFVWFGKVAGHKLSTVILVVRGDRVTGDVRGPKVGIHRIVPLADGNHAVAEIDEDLLPPDHSAEDRPSWVQRLKARLSGKARQPKGDATPPEPDGDDESASGPRRIYTLKLLVGYTAKAKEELGDLEAELTLAEQQANFSFKNSGITIRFKIGRVYEVAYDETSGNAARWPAIRDRLMPRMLADRGKTEDVAVLLTSRLESKHEGKWEGICGKANGIAALFDEAFVAVKAGCLIKKVTMAHEVGHIVGAHHNWERDDAQRRCHGLYSIPGRWRTVMAYDCEPGANVCPRLLYWSSPLLTDQFGAPMGDKDYADNVACLNQRIKVFCGPKGPAPCREANR